MNPTGPLSLSALGSFTIGGRRVQVDGQPTRVVAISRDLPEYLVDPNGTYRIEHAYVQYFLPAEQRRLPVVLVHGGGLTGSCWETTPDGRDGWLQHFLRDGRPVYVVDNVERGRAGWCPLPGMANEERPILRTEEEAWEIFRIGPPDGYAKLDPFAGCLFPVEHLSELSRQQVPRWTTTTSLSVVAIAALAAKVGPCVVIAHSQGGGIAAQAAAERSTDIAALVLLEPHGLPAQSDRLPTMPQLIVAGDFIDLSPPYQSLRRRWLEYLDAAADGGIIHEYFDLPAMGHPGNSHMIMMDSNSEGVASLVGEWIDEVAS